MEENRNMKIGIVGVGTIGSFLIRELRSDHSFELVAVADIDENHARRILADNGYPESLLLPLEKFPEDTDVYIESAAASIAGDVAMYALNKGRTVIIASIGGLGDIDKYRSAAENHGGRLLLPSGAIAGLDALKGIPPDSISSVILKTTKPAKTLADMPYLKEKGINTLEFTEPARIFEGSARDAAKAFPRSINVAAALSHAGIGLDRTRVEIWADPDGERNCHSIRVESGHGTLTTDVANVPFEENPRTSRLAAYSILATVRGLTKPVVVGT